ncbi:MAG TPA: hypothetical protein VKA34_13455 [Balneolales bacterium]|nr:hypothetical protein [Balneolales bacterium]
MDRRTFLKSAFALGGASMLGNNMIPPAWAKSITASVSQSSSPKYWKLAKTPPMGWNSYDTYGASVTESEYLANARVLQEKLLPYGYHYAVIDYLWFDPFHAPKDIMEKKPTAIDRYGRCIPATNKFPSATGGKGFKPVSDKIHAMGLKFGFHIMRGIPRVAVEKNTPIEGSSFHAKDAADTSSICKWNKDMYGVRGDTPAGQAYYDSLARLYASWDTQFIKVDDLSRPYHKDEIHAIRNALNRYAPEIVFSTSPGETPVTEGKDIDHQANMWRITNDFWDNWKSLNHTFEVLHNWQGFGGPGHWPDCDMLCLGHIGLRSIDGPRFTRFTMDEQRTVMTLWSLAPSPLMLGDNLTRLDPWTLELISNPEALAVNQDPLGKQGIRVAQTGDLEVWAKDLHDGSKAVGLFNRGNDNHKNATAHWSDLSIKGPQTVRDLWAHRELGVFEDSYTSHVPVHGAKLLRIATKM